MKLNNNNITIEVSHHGAELLSLRCNDREYMWNGDPAFWNRHAPILFPAVGKPYNNTVHINGKEYTMKQHGFARDSEFEELGDGRLRMVGTDCISNYPYHFELEARYRLEDNTVNICWTVKNKDVHNLYFQIGAHPGFMLPDYDAADSIHGYVHYFNGEGRPVSPVMVSALDDGNRVPLEDGPISIPEEMPITNDTFAHDALIFEDRQVAEATLCDKHHRPVLSVVCRQAEAFGVWAPHKEGCPFVCLEPWCGICDSKGYIGDITGRAYIQHLAPKDNYQFNYTIKLL